jgi:hypothetical protein
MRWFLERINAPRLPIIFGIESRSKNPGDFSKLEKRSVLKRDANLAEWECNLCHDERLWQIHDEDGSLFYICQNGCGKIPLSDEDVLVFEYDDNAFRQLLAKELGLITSGAIAKDSRYIGQYQGRKSKQKVFYLRTDNEAARCGFGLGSRVLVSNTGVAETDEDGVSYCALSDILAPISAKTIFDKLAFRKVVFEGGHAENKKPEPIKIKLIRLQDHVLIINNGQVSFPFNENHSSDRSEEAAELKAFKTFKPLWSNRFEMERNVIRNRKDAKLISIANLKRVSGCPTQGALDKLIGRINKRFTDKGLKIKIEGRRGQYKLRIDFE